MKIAKIILQLFIIINLSKIGFAYDDQATHRKMTEKAIAASNIDRYIISNVGLTKGLLTVFPANSENTVIYWLMEGSKLEDTPLGRAANHFHNPLKPWNESYVNDLGVVNIYTWLTGWTPLYSNITWATGYREYNGPIISRRNQTMGWDNAREYFYTALTGTTSTVREMNFAKTFQAVGQIMHLLQDMAVPAHVRNDFESHTTFGFKPWYMPYNPFEYYVKDKPQLISGLTTTIIEENRPTFPRITDFWDTTQYRLNTDPNAIITGSGLSEYTSANFLSESTIFKQDFPSPAKLNTNALLTEEQAEDGVTDRCYYIFQNGQSNKLAAYSYFTNEQPQVHDGWKYNLNDDVYKDYAKILLPRAVGYSAGLLNYFFRGQLGAGLVTRMVTTGEVAYGLKVKNWSNEIMTSYADSATENVVGNIEIYYDALVSGSSNTLTTERRLLKNCPLSTTDCWQTPPVQLLPEQETEPIFFPIPADIANSNQYTIVFRGKLGNEEGAVMAGRINYWSEEWGGDTLKSNHYWRTWEERTRVLYADNYEFYKDYRNSKHEVIGSKLISENTSTAYSVNSAAASKAYNICITDPQYIGRDDCIPVYCDTKRLEDQSNCYAFDFGADFTIPVTPNTVLRIKIDKISIDPPLPHDDSSCYEEGFEYALDVFHWQGVSVRFNNHPNFYFTIDGQEFPLGNNIKIEPGKEYFTNIFETFRLNGIAVEEPLTITSIAAIQVLDSICSVAHTQRMEVDYIRIEDR